MFEDNDEYDNEITNDNEFSEDEDILDLNVDEDDKLNEENDFKLITYKNVLENIEKKVKKSLPFLTKFERARIEGVRLQEIAYGAKPRVDTTGLTSIHEIVKKELLLRKIPFIIKRTLPNGTFEYWKLEEFESV